MASDSNPIPLSVDPLIISLLPTGLARAFRIIPLVDPQGEAILVSEQPLSTEERRVIQFTLRHRDIKVVSAGEGLTLPGTVADLIEKWYPTQEHKSVLGSENQNE